VSRLAYPRLRQIVLQDGTTETEAPFVPELSTVTERSTLLMTRPWLEWCRRVTGFIQHSSTSGNGKGDVVGPASATADAIALFSGTTGKLIKDSLKTIAQLTTDIINTILPGGTLPPTNLPANVALRDAANTFTDPTQTIRGTGPAIDLYDASQAANQRLIRLVNTGAVLSVVAQTDAGGIQTLAFQMSRAGNMTSAGNYSEYNRVTPLGHWMPTPFNAANFTGQGTMTWTVTAGNVVLNRSALIGKTLLWTIFLNGTTVGGTPTPWLLLRVPNSATAVFYSGMTPVHLNDGGGSVPGFAQVWSNDPTLVIVQKSSGANWSGTVTLGFTMTIEIQ